MDLNYLLEENAKDKYKKSIKVIKRSRENIEFVELLKDNMKLIGILLISLSFVGWLVALSSGVQLPTELGWVVILTLLIALLIAISANMAHLYYRITIKIERLNMLQLEKEMEQDNY